MEGILIKVSSLCFVQVLLLKIMSPFRLGLFYVRGDLQIMEIDEIGFFK